MEAFKEKSLSFLKTLFDLSKGSINSGIDEQRTGDGVVTVGKGGTAMEGKKKKVLVIGATTLVLVLSASAHGQQRVDVPFLFTDDQSAPQGDWSQGIPPSDGLRTDPYLNAPLTRLEYMLTQIERALNDETRLPSIKALLRERFERPPIWEDIRGSARYHELTGRIIAGYTIERMGRARKPMRDTCHEILSRLEMTLPHEHLGFTLHNTLLGVLEHKDYSAYTPMLQKVGAHFVHYVKISSETEEGKVLHFFACQKAAKDGPITYDKMSFRLR